MLDALSVLLQGNDVGNGFFTAIIAAHDQLQSDAHGGCSSGSGSGGMMQVILPEFVAYPQHLHALLCKGEAGLRQELTLYQVYYNFCLPHTILRRPLPQPVPTNGAGSAKEWWPCTPAMAAGLTDHVWSLREVLLCRGPPWPPPAGL